MPQLPIAGHFIISLDMDTIKSNLEMFLHAGINSNALKRQANVTTASALVMLLWF